jgi:hypothetical protein
MVTALDLPQDLVDDIQSRAAREGCGIDETARQAQEPYPTVQPWSGMSSRLVRPPRRGKAFFRPLKRAPEFAPSAVPRLKAWATVLRPASPAGHAAKHAAETLFHAYRSSAGNQSLTLLVLRCRLAEPAKLAARAVAHGFQPWVMRCPVGFVRPPGRATESFLAPAEAPLISPA